MKNLVSNLFNEDDNVKSIVSFEVLNSIYSHLYNQEHRVSLKMKGIHDAISVALYSFPGSFENEEAKNEIKKAGFKNAYEVLNELYKKINIAAVSEQEMEQEADFDYLHISFYSEPTPETKEIFKYCIHNFVVFFCCINDSDESNSFEVLHTNSYFTDYTKSLLDAKSVAINNPETPIERIGFKKLETVLQGICQKLKIELPQNIRLPSEDNLIQDEVGVEEELLVKQATILFNNETEDDNDDEFDFFEGVNCWHSDWKFDPEDAQYFVSDLIEEDFQFEYPEATYSHDLFPYIQTQLAKLDLELMNYDTRGDSYLFFVVNKKDVNRILELAEITEMGIDRLG
jgi:hypothetical protein